MRGAARGAHGGGAAASNALPPSPLPRARTAAAAPPLTLCRHSFFHPSTHHLITSYVTYGVPGYRAGVQGAAGELYTDYYEIYQAWIDAGLPVGDAVGCLLGPEKPRPTLLPPHFVGVGWPGGGNH